MSSSSVRGGALGCGPRTGKNGAALCGEWRRRSRKAEREAAARSGEEEKGREKRKGKRELVRGVINLNKLF